MKGRDERSGGLELAAAYVQEAMKKIALAPGAGEGYRHEMAFGRLRMDPDRTRLRRGEVALAIRDGWVPLAWPDGTWKAPALWLGEIETFGENELPEGVQVRGALLVAKVAFRFSDRLWGRAAGRLADKARRAGALGLVTVGGEDEPADSWSRIESNVSKGGEGPDEGWVRAPAFVGAWVEPRAFRALLGEVAAKAVSPGEGGAVAAPGQGLGEIEIGAVSTFEATRRSANLCGLVRGSDPARQGEVVVLSAHYDHLGIGRGEGAEDRIFNGADDDASGVAAILEMGEAFVKAPPPRSVLVIAFTLEEQRLQGSRAFAARPPIPLERIVAAVNVEMVGRPAAAGPGNFWITGYAYSSLGPALAEAARAHGVKAVADPYPMMGFFQRSDNFPLALAGIPAHSVSTFDPGKHKDYHGVDDEVDRLDLANMERVVRAVFAGARAVASGAEAPAWTEEAPEGIRNARAAGKK
ncbi:MAG: M28 family peptidase [Planctomycetales bacterium]|nr:M28 family peptidase [Planctomycetales bacterium]